MASSVARNSFGLTTDDTELFTCDSSSSPSRYDDDLGEAEGEEEEEEEEDRELSFTLRIANKLASSSAAAAASAAPLSSSLLLLPRSSSDEPWICKKLVSPSITNALSLPRQDVLAIASLTWETICDVESSSSFSVMGGEPTSVGTGEGGEGGGKESVVCGDGRVVGVLGREGEEVIRGGGSGRFIVCSSGLSLKIGEFGRERENDDELGEGVSKGTCFEMPELSASMMVESSVRRGGPGEGRRSAGIAEKKKRRDVNKSLTKTAGIETESYLRFRTTGSSCSKLFDSGPGGGRGLSMLTSRCERDIERLIGGSS